MKFGKDALERVTSTVIIVLAAVAAVSGAVETTGLLQEEWQALLAVPAIAMVLNIAKVFLAAKIGDRGTASLASEDVVTDTEVVEAYPETDDPR